jgi:hypothetical protein
MRRARLTRNGWCFVSGNKELTTTCPECGRRLSVLTRRAGGEEVPIGYPICPVGHIYRMAPGEPYPD